MLHGAPLQAVGQEMMSFSAMSMMAGSLPPNARYVTHRNECYDWGTLGWLLTTKQVTWCRALCSGLWRHTLLPMRTGLPSYRAAVSKEWRQYMTSARM